MPANNLTYRRGEIRWVNLDPTVGPEAKKIRACLIVQNDTYVVNVKVTPNNGLDQDRFIDVGQIRAVDHSRILGLVGVLESEYWELIHSCPK